MQMGNTAKHILTHYGAVNQFSQQTATSFDSTATVYQQGFHKGNDRSFRPTKAIVCPIRAAITGPAPRSGNFGAIMVPGLLEETR